MQVLLTPEEGLEDVGKVSNTDKDEEPIAVCCFISITMRLQMSEHCT